MCDESYTVGPHMYHSTRRPTMGTKGTLLRVSELYMRSGYVVAHSSDTDAVAWGMRQPCARPRDAALSAFAMAGHKQKVQTRQRGIRRGLCRHRRASFSAKQMLARRVIAHTRAFSTKMSVGSKIPQSVVLHEANPGGESGALWCGESWAVAPCVRATACDGIATPCARQLSSMHRVCDSGVWCSSIGCWGLFWMLLRYG